MFLLNNLVNLFWMLVLVILSLGSVACHHPCCPLIGVYLLWAVNFIMNLKKHQTTEISIMAHMYLFLPFFPSKRLTFKAWEVSVQSERLWGSQCGFASGASQSNEVLNAVTLLTVENQFVSAICWIKSIVSEISLSFTALLQVESRCCCCLSFGVMSLCSIHFRVCKVCKILVLFDPWLHDSFRFSVDVVRQQLFPSSELELFLKYCLSERYVFNLKGSCCSCRYSLSCFTSTVFNAEVAIEPNFVLLEQRREKIGINRRGIKMED